jgi:hypothetical protein
VRVASWVSGDCCGSTVPFANKGVVVGVDGIGEGEEVLKDE